MTQPTPDSRHTVDNLTSDQLDQLQADLAWAREQTRAAQQEATDAVTRAEAAEQRAERAEAKAAQHWVSATVSGGPTGTVRSGSAKRSTGGPVGGPRTSAASEKRPSGVRVSRRLPVRDVGPLPAVRPGPPEAVQDNLACAVESGMPRCVLYWALWHGRPSLFGVELLVVIGGGAGGTG
ncbi:alanine-zipper protein [Streptomyces sp. WAC01280]|uniref:alanine-zipper protein n=1 Tax=Streptomyces sp. WAC01280 TaxID=2487424 RepID=UPI000F768B91|nr:alanine-zipper protein [Streptomyces sp. WAC01280]RSS59840.1 hypothetical protein EF909_08240 [Streptomyces sp. WAC01280]